MFDHQQLMAALEPLVLELEAVRVTLDELKAAGGELEAVRGELTTLKAGLGELEAVRLELIELKAHRLDAPAWSPGVYRKGAVVQHFLGQYFEATVDTASEPGDGVSWRRLGSHGFRYRGLHVAGASYELGDLVARDGSMMLHTGAELTWLALRGKPGPRGPGPKGETGA